MEKNLLAIDVSILTAVVNKFDDFSKAHVNFAKWSDY